MKPSNIDAQYIAEALKAKRVRQGWLALCPSHDDNNPSLSINEGKNGKVLIHCFAGCAQHEVIEALKSLRLWAAHE